MDWREILEIHKGLDLFFNVSIPAAVEKQAPFGHVLLICPDSEVRRYFAEELIKGIQPLAVEKPKLLSEEKALITPVSDDEKPFIGSLPVRWDSETTCSDIAAALTNLQLRDVLLLNKEQVDLPFECYDLLANAMDSFALDIAVGKGSAARSIRLDLPEFTFVACVAEETEDLRAFSSHFSYVIRISKSVLTEICEKAILLKAQEEGCSFSDDACEHIVRCASSDCMAAVNYAMRVIEYMRHYHSIGTQITDEHTKIVLGSLGVDAPPESPKANDEVVTLLRDIQKKLSGLATDLNTIKTTLKAIQGEETDHTLTDIARALDRIEESMY